MKHKIILDTDPGIDDAVMISTALTDPQLDVALITTVAGNVTVDKTTKNALKLVDFFNKDVPVAAGAADPLIKKFEDAARIHGESGMAGYDFPEPTSKPLTLHAVQALHETLKNSAEPITLITTGAYTNIALLLREYPEIKPKIKQIIAMGGSLGRGNMTSAAEFNVFTDPHAAQIMYSSQIPLVMVGLDVTLAGRISDETLLVGSVMKRPLSSSNLGVLVKCSMISSGMTLTMMKRERRSTISKRSFISNIQKLLKLKTTGSISSQKALQLGKL